MCFVIEYILSSAGTEHAIATYRQSPCTNNMSSVLLDEVLSQRETLIQHFLVILKRKLQNYKKILNKCFIGSNDKDHVSVFIAITRL